MCLGVPGQLVEVYQRDELPMGRVDFSGVRKEVCLAYTPEAAVGDYVLVHVGFTLSVIDAQEAAEIFGYLEAIGQAGEEMQSNLEVGTRNSEGEQSSPIPDPQPPIPNP